MGQFLAILIIPPLVGIITYAMFRFVWEKDEQFDHVAPSGQLDAGRSDGGHSSSTNLTSA